MPHYYSHIKKHCAQKMISWYFKKL